MLWSVGKLLPTNLFGRKIASDYGMAVFASQTASAPTAMDRHGKALPIVTSERISVSNYTGGASIEVFDVGEISGETRKVSI